MTMQPMISIPSSHPSQLKGGTLPVASRVLSMAGYSQSHLSILCIPLMRSTGSPGCLTRYWTKTLLHGTREGFTILVPHMK
ncbi:hypothetical protein PVL29_000551 [Vitis rotundifolia]|uniref:Uncharacterized protein n=1 Tax=Vitis rotundifolia TaxID=103349 RepID=A0AA39ALX0_VITRO|nr:hypothetical protein PVL29_000551 [Vitis rotundifolia]